MTINDVVGERVYHVWDIFRGFLGHNFVFGPCTLKLETENLKPKNLETYKRFLKQHVFFNSAYIQGTRKSEWCI